MNDLQSDAAQPPMSSSRLAQFQAEVDKMKVTGGGANPERLGAMWGIGLTIFGLVISGISFWSALDSPISTASTFLPGKGLRRRSLRSRPSRRKHGGRSAPSSSTSSS